MTGAGHPRWLLSFADLLMLLLAFFVVLGASRSDPAKLGAGMRAAFGGVPGAADPRAPVALDPARLFEPGEAVLRPGAAPGLAAIGRRFARGAILLTSEGEARASGRLDRFELAAARTAALARALAAGGIAADRIAIAMRPAGGLGAAQRITIAAAGRPFG